VVAQVDLPATLLDLAALPFDRMDGVSQRGAIASGRVATRPVYSETLFPRYHFGWSELRAATDDRFRYIRAPRPELYDVRADPGETRNLMGERPPPAAALVAWLDGLGASAPPTPGTVTAEVSEKLAALGYVGAARAQPAASPLADPKDKVDAYEAYKRAFALQHEGKDAESARALRKLLADNPAMLDAWEDLGLSLVRMGREAEGVTALGKVIEGDPGRASAHLALARIHSLSGHRDLAEKHAELASATDPGRGYETLALIVLDRNRLAEAAAYARKSLDADRNRVMSRFVLALVARRTGRCEDAIAEYREAAEAQRRQKGLVVRDLHSGLADCLARLGREGEAEAEFKAEVATFPHSREGRVGLAMLYRSQGRDTEIREVLGGVVTASPRAGADEYWTVVHTLTVLGDLPAAREWAGRARALFPGDPRFRR
jgi:tetratricopeptide (TPR) repeat protein